MKEHIMFGVKVAITIALIAATAELLGVWGYVFQPYAKFTGKATAE
jgi:hypothetical protein